MLARRRRDDISEGGLRVRMMMMVRQKEEGEREGRNVRLRKRMSAGKQNNELAENVRNFPRSGILVFLVTTSSQNPGLFLSGTSSTNRFMTWGMK